MARWVQAIARGSALAAFAFVTWLCANGPLQTLARLDGPGMLRDFVNIYLDQGQRLLRAPPSLNPRWFYPPLPAALMQSFALLGVAAFWVWLALQLALIAWLVALCRRELAGLGRADAWAGALGLTFTSLPIVHGLKWGQLSLLVVLLSVTALCSRKHGAPWLLGLAASLKLYPVAYLLAAIAQRRWSFIAHCLLALLVLGAVLPCALLGPALALAFAARSLQGVSALGSDAAKGQTLGAAIERWFHAGVDFGDGVVPWLFPLPGAARTAVTVLACLLVLALSLRRAWQRPERDLVSALLVIAALTLAIRPGWDHYYAVLPLAQAATLARASQRSAVIAAALGWAVSAAPLLAFALRPGLYALSASLGLSPVACLLTWLGLYISSATSPTDVRLQAVPRAVMA